MQSANNVQQQQQQQQQQQNLLSRLKVNWRDPPEKA